jgi:hypothetical protein
MLIKILTKECRGEVFVFPLVLEICDSALPEGQPSLFQVMEARSSLMASAFLSFEGALVFSG